MADDKTITIPVNLVVNVTEVKKEEAPEPSVADAPVPEEQKEAAEKAKSKKNPAAAMVSQMAKKTVNTALNNYGNLTGDYTTQQNIQTAVSETTDIITAVKLGWVGMALYGFNKAIEGYNYFSNIKRSERDAKFKQERVGLVTDRA